ncbi:MAG TPA: hypothetical protein VLF18_00560 [Tahibacter sp.]|uniref:hypothetical protein n=1 Tax=Tahibacter sp. TaxID=2056211 RepID=UPI002B51CF50|nr:hypothetical protein [Tahibacter sp.]HSX58664.1 hypothetical protein [Tahibacter sp.]
MARVRREIGRNAVGARQRERGIRLFFGAGLQREHAAMGFAVVAQQHAAVALDAADHDAEARSDLQMRGDRRFVGLCAPRRAAPREALGERAERSEGFGADGLGRRRLEIGRGIGEAERFRARRIAQEAHDREQFVGASGSQHDAAHLRRADVAAAFATMVVDLQVTELFAADFERVALPEHGLLRRRLLRRGAQRDLVLADDGGDRRGFFGDGAADADSQHERGEQAFHRKTPERTHRISPHDAAARPSSCREAYCR